MLTSSSLNCGATAQFIMHVFVLAQVYRLQPHHQRISGLRWSARANGTLCCARSRDIEAVGHRMAAKGMENQSRLRFASGVDPFKKVRFRVGIHVYWSIIHVWLVSQQIMRAEVKMSRLMSPIPMCLQDITLWETLDCWTWGQSWQLIHFYLGLSAQIGMHVVGVTYY